MKFLYFVLALSAVLILMFVRDSHTQAIDSTTKCNTYCPNGVTPVCGTDDAGNTQTFTNECTMDSENCIKRTNYQKTGDGACP